MTHLHRIQHAPIFNPSTPQLAEFARKLVEGEHLWGRVDVSPAGRTSWSRTRLTVFPPGTNGLERRALQFARLWPILGAFVALFVMLALSAWPQWLASGTGVALYAAGFWVGHILMRDLKPRLRRLTVVVVPIGGGLDVLGDIELLDALRLRLNGLDVRLHRGEITPAEYESVWAEVYEALPATEPSRRSRSLAG